MSIGFFFFFYQESWITITLNYPTTATPPKSSKIYQKNVAIWIPRGKGLFKEICQIIQHNEQTETLKQLIDTFFLVWHEADLLEHGVQTQAIILSPTQSNLFISLQQNPFNPQSSCYEKLQLIQCLFKSIKAIAPTVLHVQLLVQHQPLQDVHLDFGYSWPIDTLI